ncbi:DUF4240 domain-containing protein [Shewanella eurypsychrophilus]|uniref:DUF4240 domain-containing protein n=1 Tax=Shewanella eurypsychrophilus TaxID=2593656 RepID=A0ABX6VI31_9GAMM|nr:MULTISPECIES: DUF4240 domain-containing protein [Shewanella]QFU24612.1 DUF4240 domain-containing protein [Shewanella sp. YLB-09]QPG59809.1 DUF4240 domain-containing protein [Shewanella eurypsychrophilus]
MTETEFWQLVTRETATQDQVSLADNLKAKLELLSDEDLLEFDKIFGQQMRKSYFWSVWGAAYIITGCDSEYAFAEFRCFLISLGQDWYEKVVASPDDVALLPEWPEKDGYPYPYPFLDEYDLIAGQIFEDRTGDELPFVPSGKATPQGKKFTTKKKQLKLEYPQLSQRFPF